MAFRSIPASVGTPYTTSPTTSVVTAKVVTPVVRPSGARCIPTDLYRSYWREGDRDLFVDYRGVKMTTSMVAQRDFDEVCTCVHAPVESIYLAERGVPGSQKRVDYCWSTFFQKPAQGVFDAAAKQWLWQPGPQPVLAKDHWLSGMPNPCGHIIGSCYDAAQYDGQNYVQRGQQRLLYTEGSPKANPYRTFFPVDEPGIPDRYVRNLDDLNRLRENTDSSASMYEYSKVDNPLLNQLILARQTAAKAYPIRGVDGASLGEDDVKPPMALGTKMALVAGGVVAAGAVVFLLTRKGK
jgi:hypothetical protein